MAPPYFLPLKAVASNLAEIGGNYLVGGHFWGHEDGYDYLDVDDNLVDGERGYKVLISLWPNNETS